MFMNAKDLRPGEVIIGPGTQVHYRTPDGGVVMAILHPRDRINQLPMLTPPRVSISHAAFEQDKAAFDALVAARDFGAACSMVENNGFSLTLADVEESKQSAFKAFAAQYAHRLGILDATFFS